MNIDFLPQIKTVATIAEHFTTEEIKNEPMLFQADWDFATRFGGPLTRRILTTLRNTPEFNNAYQLAHSNKLNLVIDTRVNMVMQGWYPSIPGWHCDDVPRSEKYAQPDFSQRKDACQHFTIVLSDTDMPDLFTGAGVSGTEYLTTPTTLSVDPEAVWKSVDSLLNDMLAAEVLGPSPTKFLKDGELLQFNQQALHRTSPARVAGWRLFFRCSFTYRKATNEVRRQAQAYIPLDKAGW